jgi:MoxR-like ATPase
VGLPPHPVHARPHAGGHHGHEILQSDETGRRRDLVFHRGPIFANLILADEINRTPPKTQAALLEAMQELAVTVNGKTYPLAPPFIVVATQNPSNRKAPIPCRRPSSTGSC